VRAAQERNQYARDDWIQRLADWRADQLVFVDESAANERTLDRKYGWAPINTAPLEIRPARRTERYSMLPAYTVDGYIAWQVVQASYTTALFNDFIANHLLPLCSPYPGPRSIIVMDNAQIHRSQVWGIGYF
jgi:DDE superfamily endonuclease